jgi:hypothetical protein
VEEEDIKEESILDGGLEGGGREKLELEGWCVAD